MKKKSIVASLMTIMMSASLIAGGTYALFTSESTVNVAVTSGTVDVVATVDEDSITYGSTLGANLAQTAVTFSKTSNTISLEYLVPGDYVEFDLTITNKSTVTAKYQTAVSVVEDTGLFAGLDVTIGGETGYGAQEKASKWATIEPNQTIDNVSVRIELPERSGLTFGAENKDNQYQGKSCKLAYVVRAVQGNAPTYDPAPVASMTELPEEEKTISCANIAMLNQYIDVQGKSVDMAVGLSFAVTETMGQISASQYGKWIADYEIWFDKDITYKYSYTVNDGVKRINDLPKEADVMLIGQSDHFSETLWVPLPLLNPSESFAEAFDLTAEQLQRVDNGNGEITMTLKAGTPIRLIRLLAYTHGAQLGFNIDSADMLTYETVASLVEKAFNCGIVTDLTALGIPSTTPANTGVYLELNLYDPQKIRKEPITCISYDTVLVDETVRTVDELQTAINAGKSTIKIDGMITLDRNITVNRDIAFIGVGNNSGIIGRQTPSASGHIFVENHTVTYQNLTISEARNDWYEGFDYKNGGDSNYINCTINGITTYSTNVNFTGCTFLAHNKYGLWIYEQNSTVNVDGCTFIYGDRAIKLYDENTGYTAATTLNIKNTKFVAGDGYTLKKPIINVDDTHRNSNVKFIVNVENIEIADELKSLSVCAHDNEAVSDKTQVTIK